MIESTRRLTRLILAASAAAPALIGAGLAAAAEPAAHPVAGPGEVVVTAEKRTETLREVPQSVSVITGQSLERQQAFNLQDYALQIPNLSITQAQPGDARIVLRGVNTGGDSSTVAVYVDETPFGSSSGLVNGGVLAADFDTFDISRIEVLRGPQGTLYGASSLGGVLKFVTNAPDLDRFSFRGQVGAEGVAGGGGDWNVDGVVNAPLGDKAALRVSGYYRRDGGFVDEVGTAGSLVKSNVDWDEIYGGRASLLVKPMDSLSVRLTAVLQDSRDGAPTVVDADPVTGKPLYGDFTRSAYHPERSQVNYRLFNGTLNWDLGFASLISATSYGRLDQSRLDDITAVQAAPGLTFGDYFTGAFSTPADPLGGIYPHTLQQRKWTEEVRLASPSNQRLEWLLGGYYTHETGALAQIYDAFDLGTLQTVTSLPLLAGLNLDSRYEEYAGFANATLHLTPRLSVALGGRVSHNRQQATERVDGLLEGGLTVFSPVNSSETVFTYSAAPRLELSDNASIYARVAKGYRPGGPNLLPPGAPAGTPNTYKADSLVSYEAGLKADFLDRRLSIDASAFYLDWTDIQLLAVINGVGLNANGGTAVSKGVEFTLTLRPVPELSLIAGGALTSAHLTEDTPAVVGGLKGDRLPYAPKWSLTLSGDYERPISAGFTGYAGATLALTGPQAPDFDPTYQATFGQRFMIRRYARLDLRAGVRQDRWSLEVYAKNVTNSGGLINVDAYAQLPNGALGITPIRPRTIGATLGVNF